MVSLFRFQVKSFSLCMFDISTMVIYDAATHNTLVCVTVCPEGLFSGGIAVKENLSTSYQISQNYR